MSSVAWLDLSNGVSGDMLLGALVSAGVPLATMSAALDPLRLPITLSARDVDRAGMAATKVYVDVSDDHRHTRTWRDVRQLLNSIDEPIRGMAAKVFAALAAAEGHVHGIAPDDVHFHEVGALDAIADVVAVSAGMHALGVDQITASPIALGSGTAQTAHGSIPVPVPAVLALAARAHAEVFGGPGDFEMATPTGVAIVTSLDAAFGAMPPMKPHTVGVGAGGRNPAGRPNVVRIVIGDTSDHRESATATVLEANIDDMDPRLWPGVLDALLRAGAGDAWLSPIAMKKGRPAHTLCAIVTHERVSDVRSAMFAHTTTIGIRESMVVKHALDRQFKHIVIDGELIAVKLGILPGGQVVNAMPEFDDVARAANNGQRSIKDVLAQALGHAQQFVTG